LVSCYFYCPYFAHLFGHKDHTLIYFCPITYLYSIFIWDYSGKIFKNRFFSKERIEELNTTLDQINSNPLTLINTIISSKEKRKLNIEEKKLKNIEKLAVVEILCSYVERIVLDYTGRKAYASYWLIQICWIFLVSVLFFTFINYNLYLVDASQFIISGNVNVFEFIYYTLKTITFNSIDSIKPNSPLTKIIETLSFMLLGVYIIVIIISLGFSWFVSRFEEDSKAIISYCKVCRSAIHKYSNENYGTGIIEAANDHDSVREVILERKKELSMIARYLS